MTTGCRLPGTILNVNIMTVFILILKWERSLHFRLNWFIFSYLCARVPGNKLQQNADDIRCYHIISLAELSNGTADANPRQLDMFTATYTSNPFAVGCQQACAPVPSMFQGRAALKQLEIGGPPSRCSPQSKPIQRTPISKQTQSTRGAPEPWLASSG